MSHHGNFFFIEKNISINKTVLMVENILNKYDTDICRFENSSKKSIHIKKILMLPHIFHPGESL